MSIQSAPMTVAVPTDAELTATLAENLARARARKGLKQRDVAMALNIGEMQISRWERAEATPHAVSLWRLANLYGVPIDVLFVKDHPMLPPVVATPAPVKSRKSNRPGTH